jgi:hypothetical protein
MLFYATRKYSKVALGGDFQTARQVYPKALMTQNQEPSWFMGLIHLIRVFTTCVREIELFK